MMADTATLVNVNKGIYTINYDRNSDGTTDSVVHVNANNGVVTATNLLGSRLGYLDSGLTVGLQGADYDEVYFTAEGLYNIASTARNVVYQGKATIANKDMLAITVSSPPGTVYLSTDEIINAKTYMYVTAEDIRTGEVQDVATIDVNSEYQIIKQQWNTTIKYESYWWIDEDHIMAVTNSQLLFLRKVLNGSDYALDDWNGDQWITERVYNKSDYLPNEAVRFGVSCVNGEVATSNNNAHPGAIFWTMEATSSSTFKIRMYTYTQEAGLVQPRTQGKTITINTKTFGQDLVTSFKDPSIDTYVAMSADALLSSAKITATHVGHAVMIGLVMDKALRQWTLIFTDSTLDFATKITGYGYVAPDGGLTGGELPEVAFDTDIGFKTAVKNIDDLKETYSDSNITGDFPTEMQGVYGNASQQWYVYKDITNVISHYTFKEQSSTVTNPGLGLGAIPIPIENHYVDNYCSTSFYVNKLLGMNVQVTTLMGLLPFDSVALEVILGLLTGIASPAIWFLNPNWTKFGFLEQSLGQYAYVYNSSSEMMINAKKDKDEDASSTQNQQLQTKDSGDLLSVFDNMSKTLTRDAITFDKQEKEQTVKTDDTKAQQLGFWYALLVQGIAGVQEKSATPAQVNATQNQTSTSDIAKQFSQFAIENAVAAAATDIGGGQSTNLALASKVVAVKTLDMFYSTSANSNMYAGPGYVCHRFIAQCVAQGVSNRFIQANQNGMFTILTPLSIAELKLRNMLLEIARDIATTLASSLISGSGGQFTLGGVASGGSIAGTINQVVGVVSLALQAITDVMIAQNNFFIELLPTLCKCLMSADGASFMNYGNISSHTIDIEAKHHYGNKSVDFMYPCFGATSTKFTVEQPTADIKDVKSEVDFGNKSGVIAEYFENSTSNSVQGKAANAIFSAGGEYDLASSDGIDNVTSAKNIPFTKSLKGDLYSEYVYVRGISRQEKTPADMAVVEGTTTFLPVKMFKNENIDCTAVFAPPPTQDYMLSEDWGLGVTATAGGVVWTSIKDTKILDGSYTNTIITNDVCLVASPYCALEVKQQIEEAYVRPYAVTPTTIAFNQTGLNVAHEAKMYHGFDGVGYRTTQWTGSSGIDMERLAVQYCFQTNDHFKRSNILPPNQFFGNFRSYPTVAITSREEIYQDYTIDNMNIGVLNGNPKEDRNIQRYALPVFTEQLANMPSVVKTLSSYKLDVWEGTTGLTSMLRMTQGDYKAPLSVDFTINKNVYRATEEYVMSVNEAGLTVGDVVIKLGLEFIGATPEQAFFYSESTRAYYSFTGGNTITKRDVWSRFKDIKDGKWDFVNQEVVFQCLGNASRLFDGTSDTDSDASDNLMIIRMDNASPSGDITPPNKTIFNANTDSSWFKTLSMAGGLTFQGPNRYIVNRFICLDYMLEDIVENKGKWVKVSRDVFNPFRKYPEDFQSVSDRVGAADDYTYTKATSFEEGVAYYTRRDNDNGNPIYIYCAGLTQFNTGTTYYVRTGSIPTVHGWTHNPFLFCTAPLGVNEETDCLYEWEVTFTWTDEMDTIYGTNEYACVNVMAQTMCPGGKKRSEITHLYLYKELFTRGQNSGYYSFRFASRNGAGNREQLFIWSDAYIAMTGLQLEYKVVTVKRQQQASVEQLDIRKMHEM